VDFALYLRVLWRFRFVVALGTLLALTLALLSTVSISFRDGHPEFVNRESEQWASDSYLFVTEEGFPLGRSILDDVVPTNVDDPVKVGKDQAAEFVPRYGDPSRFALLAILYSRIATGDTVLGTLGRQKKLKGIVTAQAVVNDANGGILPIVQIRGTATSARRAAELAQDASRALREYVLKNQQANNISRDRRVQLQFLNRATPPKLLVPRSRTRPIFIFLAMMIATIGLAFVLENLRPRIQPAVGVDDTKNELRAEGSSRRSA
jgi:hypothetical protein